MKRRRTGDDAGVTQLTESMTPPRRATAAEEVTRRLEVEPGTGLPSGPVKSAPARLIAGLAARRRADAGPFTLLPCDNLPGNGAVAARVVHDLAEAVDPDLAAWIDDSVSTVTTTVDRIIPRTTPDDSRAVQVVASAEELVRS